MSPVRRSRLPVAVVDVDDVVADLVPEWVKLTYEMLSIHYGIRATAPSLNDPNWDTWDLVNLIPREHHEALWHTLDHPALYDRVPLVPNALDGVRCLRDHGYRVVFATHATVGHAGRKLRYLQEHGFLAKHKYADMDYAEIRDKSLVHATIRIDDKPANLTHTSGTRVLFLRHFRRDLPRDGQDCGADVVALGWEHIINLLELNGGNLR